MFGNRTTATAPTLYGTLAVGVDQAQLVSVPESDSVLTVRHKYDICKHTIKHVERLCVVKIHLNQSIWPDIHGTFAGVPRRILWTDCGSSAVSAGKTLSVSGYSGVIPREVWRHYTVLLATRRHGQPLPLPSKGPLLILLASDAKAERIEDKEFTATRWNRMLREIDASENSTGGTPQ